MRKRYIIIGAVAVLLLAMAFMGPQFRMGPAQRDFIAELQIRSFSASLQLYAQDVGMFPTQTQGLLALVEPPSGVSGWAGPYMTELPKDPWGNAYVYRTLNDGKASQIASLGADGRLGGDGKNTDVTSGKLTPN